MIIAQNYANKHLGKGMPLPLNIKQLVLKYELHFQ
jgi:hypothetical protein